MTTPHEAIQNMIAPLRQELEKIDAQIRQTEDDLKALKEARQPLLRMLNIADPDPNARRPGPKPKRANPEDRIAAATLDQVQAWLIANRNGDMITGPDLRDDPTFDILAYGRINDALAALANRGVLRLDHKGGHRGVQKFYKLVRDAQA